MMIEKLGLLLLSINLVTAFTSLWSTPKGSLHSSEKKALIQLYRYTNGNTWINNKNWLEGDPCLNYWRGVRCEYNSKTGYQTVIELVLSSQNLTGRLPFFINYQYLNIKKKSKSLIESKLPSELYQEINHYAHNFTELKPVFPKMKIIDLSENYLIGSIPETWTLMKELKVLELFENDLSGCLPNNLGNWKKLKIFSIDHNEISGPIPESFIQMENLRTALFHNNRLNGTLDDRIRDMFRLNTLTTVDNDFAEPLPTWLGDFDHFF